MSLKTMPLYATLWREFYERPTIVYFMARPEGEYHFRDVVSLMEISRVFPHGLTQVRFCPVIPRVTPVENPAPGEGIIITGPTRALPQRVYPRAHHQQSLSSPQIVF